VAANSTDTSASLGASTPAASAQAQVTTSSDGGASAAASLDSPAAGVDLSSGAAPGDAIVQATSSGPVGGATLEVRIGSDRSLPTLASTATSPAGSVALGEAGGTLTATVPSSGSPTDVGTTLGGVGRSGVSGSNGSVDGSFFVPVSGAGSRVAPAAPMLPLPGGAALQAPAAVSGQGSTRPGSGLRVLPVPVGAGRILVPFVSSAGVVWLSSPAIAFADERSAAGHGPPRAPAPLFAPGPAERVLFGFGGASAGAAGAGAGGSVALFGLLLLLVGSGVCRYLRRRPHLLRPPALRFVLERPG